MRIDLGDVFLFTNPATAIGVLIVGAVYGWLFWGSAERRASAWYQVRALFFGELFAVFMAVLRFTEGVETWESWVGFGMLWAAYCLGFAMGSRARGHG